MLLHEQVNIIMIVTFIVALHILNKARTYILHQFFDESLEKSKSLQQIQH